MADADCLRRCLVLKTVGGVHAARCCCPTRKPSTPRRDDRITSSHDIHVGIKASVWPFVTKPKNSAVVEDMVEVSQLQQQQGR
jgi:hypothetical protein